MKIPKEMVCAGAKEEYRWGLRIAGKL